MRVFEGWVNNRKTFFVPNFGQLATDTKADPREGSTATSSSLIGSSARKKPFAFNASQNAHISNIQNSHDRAVAAGISFKCV